jgi:hypothetical protein
VVREATDAAVQIVKAAQADASCMRGEAEKEAAAAAAETAAKNGVAPVAAAPTPASPAAPAAPAAPAPAQKKQVKQAKKAEAPKVPEPLPPSPKEEAKAEEADDEFIPITLGGKKYVRLGQRRTDGNHIWASGDLWESKKGQKGSYVGVLQDDGKIDNTAEEPELE